TPSTSTAAIMRASGGTRTTAGRRPGTRPAWRNGGHTLTDTSGALATGDAPVSRAAVTLILMRDSNGDGSFTRGAGDQRWTFAGTTSSNGSFRAKLINPVTDRSVASGLPTRTERGRLAS